MPVLILLSLLIIGASSAHGADPCLDLYTSTCEKNSTSHLLDGTQPYAASHIQYLWTQIKIAAQAVISKKTISEKTRKPLAQTLEQITLEVKVCLDDPTLSNANFSHAGKTVTYCSGSFLSTTSLFQQVAVLAHELGHSLEPCNSNFEDYVFKNVETCLRTEDSVQAQVWGFINQEQFQTKCASFSSACERGLSPACRNYERIGCEKNEPRCLKDQIDESFADWFSTEVLGEMLAASNLFLRISNRDFENGFKNIVKDSCGSSYLFDSKYPQPQNRYNKILLAHPVVRAKLNCHNSDVAPLYCPVN